MGLFRKRGSRNNLLDDEEEKPNRRVSQPPPPPPAAPAIDALAPPNSVICTVHEPWQWILEAAFKEGNNLTIVDDVSELPTASQSIAAETDPSPPATPSGRRRFKKPASACPLRVEVKDGDGRLIRAAHANSEAFDGLEDKDELFRTLQRCRCEHLELSPPSRLVNWDVTKQECENVVGKEMPTLLGNKGTPETIAVLKEPMGSRGTGIFFVRTAEEIHNIIDEHKKEAMAKPNFLDDLIASKGRIPSWVLQAEVQPCLLIRDRKKFHIRTYVVGVERFDIDELLDTFMYRRHEVRIASESIPADQNDDSRRKAAHVTNGAKESAFLNEVDELKGLQDPLEVFLAEIFAKHVIKDLSRRVAMGAQDSDTSSQASKFVVAGLDIMVTEDKRLYLLEANVNPIMPPPDVLTEDFQKHLIGFVQDLTNLVVGKQSPNFISCNTILSRRES